MNTSTIIKSNKATFLRFEKEKMIISLEDGREFSVPLEWFSTLRNATISQLENYRFIGNGEGIHWEELNEDILVENLLN